MKLHIPTIALALVAAAGVASGQHRRGGGREARPPMPPEPPVLALFDADRDGEISEDEIANASEVLACLDRNGDGRITAEDSRPQRGGNQRPNQKGEPKGPPPDGRPVPPLVAGLDADHDGKISAKEIESAPESLKKLDANGDGELTPEELRPHGPPPLRFEDDEMGVE
jgi:hypothetical protein